MHSEDTTGSAAVATAAEVPADFREALESPQARPYATPWHETLALLPVRLFWSCFAAVLGLTAWNGLWLLGDTFVRDHDEGRYGVAASEMLHAHSMLVTTYAGATEFWNLKPPLGYWLLDLSYVLVGENQLGLRLPSAICALLTVALAMLVARRAAGPRVAILSGIALATSFGFMGHHGARSGNLDTILTLPLFVFLALSPRLWDSRAARLGGGLALALAFLIKSFAILPYLAAVMLYCLMTRGIKSWRIWPVAFAIVSVTTAVWAVARSVAEGSWEFVRRMFVEDLLLRSTTQIDPHANGGVWDYVGDLCDRLAPWPLMILLAWALTRGFARQRFSADFGILLMCYALVPLLLFTLAQTHHSHYMIPAYPAWSILGAAATIELLRRAQRNNLIAPAAVFIVACVLACEIRLVTHIEVRDRAPPSQVFLASLRARLGDRPQLLRTTFTPSYSERFFLQVVDGYTVDDGPNIGSQLGPESIVLQRKSGPESARVPLTSAGVVVLAQDDNYRLVRLSE